MRVLIFIFLVCFLNAKQLEPVKFVDKNKFSGLWYEIARTYNSFQENCVASSVEYRINKDGNYDIYNRCFENEIGARLIKYEGVGKSISKNANMAKIEMTYFWIFSKDYKVIFLNSDYTKAIVSDNDLDNIWIMSRTPKIDKTQLNDLVKILTPHIDTSKLIYTLQDEKGRYK